MKKTNEEHIGLENTLIKSQLVVFELEEHVGRFLVDDSSTIHPLIIFSPYNDNVFTRINTITSRDQFKPIRIFIGELFGGDGDIGNYKLQSRPRLTLVNDFGFRIYSIKRRRCRRQNYQYTLPSNKRRS